MAPGGRDDGPTLLAGGNPQIPKGDGPEPVRAYLDAMPGWKGDVGRHVASLVEAAVPEARQAVRWNSPFWGIEDRGWFLSLHCFTRDVKVTFLNGVHLDPAPPVATRYDARCLHLGEDDEIDDRQLTAWIEAAAAAPGDELF